MKLGNIAGVIFTAMQAKTERPEVIKSHAWRIRGFMWWLSAEIRHKLLHPFFFILSDTEQLARCRHCHLVYFSASSSRYPLLKVKYETRWQSRSISFTPYKQVADETQVSQHTQTVGRQAWASQNTCTSPYISNTYHRIKWNSKHSSKHVNDPSLSLFLSSVISLEILSNIPRDT